MVNTVADILLALCIPLGYKGAIETPNGDTDMTQTRPNIALRTIGMVGDRFGPEQPIVVDNLHCAHGQYIRQIDFVKHIAQWMQPSLIGRSYPVNCIERKRTEKLIAYCAKHGFTCGFWSERQESEFQAERKAA